MYNLALAKVVKWMGNFHIVEVKFHLHIELSPILNILLQVYKMPDLNRFV